VLSPEELPTPEEPEELPSTLEEASLLEAMPVVTSMTEDGLIECSPLEEPRRQSKLGKKKKVKVKMVAMMAKVKTMMPKILDLASRAPALRRW